MAAFPRLISLTLRVFELICASVVAGIIGSYLHSTSTSTYPHSRFIYTEVIAGLSILLALLCSLPFASSLTHWPADILLSCAWFAAFGLLVNAIGDRGCGTSVFDWAGITHGGVCNRWKAAEAFSFLSAALWLVSALVGVWFLKSRKRVERGVVQGGGGNAGRGRARWFRRSGI